MDDRWLWLWKPICDSWESTKSRTIGHENMFCWHMLAAFILSSIEDFYQISANEFIDPIVVTLGKVDVRLHINHSENRQKKENLFPVTKADIGVLLNRGNCYLLFFWPLIWLYSLVQKGQKQQAADYMSVIISNMTPKHKAREALWILDTVLTIHFVIWSEKNPISQFNFLSSSIFASVSDYLL